MVEPTGRAVNHDAVDLIVAKFRSSGFEMPTAIADEKAAASKGWPRTGRRLTTAPRRTIPQLRLVGMTIQFDRVRDRLIANRVNPNHGDFSVDSVDSDAKSFTD